MKYHYSDRFFTYSVRRNRSFPTRECLLFLVLSGGRATTVGCRPTVRFVAGGGSLAAPGPGVRARRDPLRGHYQVGSLTGAVHLSNDNAGVLRPAQRGQKPRVEQKGKCWLDPDFQYEYGLRKQGLSILLTL